MRLNKKIGNKIKQTLYIFHLLKKLNNLDNNLNNESTNYNSNNVSKSTKIDWKKCTNLKYHISSNSIINNNINNNNINNICNQINSYQMLNYTDLSSQIINNNYIANNKNFNKTSLNQYNNIWDISGEVIKIQWM